MSSFEKAWLWKITQSRQVKENKHTAIVTIIYRLLVFLKKRWCVLARPKPTTFQLRNILIFTAFLCRDAVEIVERDVPLPHLSYSSGSSEDEEEESIEYLHDDPMAPIYQRGLRKGLATKKVVDILFNPRRECLARAVPTAVPINSVFVVDISAPHVKHYKNVLADDLGAWNPTGTKQQFYRTATKKNPVRKASQAEYEDNAPHVFKCTRSFYRNESSPDLQRIFIYLTGKAI